jgi:NTE family protein
MPLPADVHDLIERSGMFGHLDAAARSALAARLTWLSLPGGRPLFKAGEPAEALYLLRSGSLGVFRGAGELAHLIAAGEAVGEISLITEDRRRYSVRALRDSELLRLDRRAFEELAQLDPRAALGVARIAIERLRAGHDTEHRSVPRTFAILPVDGNVPARALAMKLADALGAYGRCVLLGAEHGRDRSSDWYAQCEADADFVIYLDTVGHGPWRQRCLRQADVLLMPALAAEPARAWPEAAAEQPSRAHHRPRHLILLHAGHHVSLGAASRWRGMFEGEISHHHICRDADIGRLARLVSGHGRGLILAGGGARGLAHLGALRALHDAGRHFDTVGGTSIGAVIAAGVACQWDVDSMVQTYRRAFVDGKPLSDWTFPLVALTRGRRATLMLRQAFGALDIEDLPLPFFCISTNLSGGGMIVHRRGPLWLWLRASSAIPGILPPVLHHGQVFVDGALVNNLPTDVMSDDGVGHITAVDIRAENALAADVEESASPGFVRLWLERRSGVHRPGLLSTLVRAAMVNAESASAGRRARADLLLTPQLEHIGMLDWRNWQRAIDAGYRHTMAALEAAACGRDDT